MAQFWEKTIQVFGNYIEYPQLTEKYLRRPPFKYIFQIFLTLNSKTGFAKDTFKEPELNPDYYDTPEKKMAFLKQAIRIIYEAAQKPCPFKPQNVIKGTECEATNEFLQDMYFAAVSFEESKRTAPAPEPKKKPVAAAHASTKEDHVGAKEEPQSTVHHPVKQGKEPAANPTERPHLQRKEAQQEPAKTHLQTGKENLTEKPSGALEQSKKTAQQVIDSTAKEEKLIVKSRVNSGNQSETGIKMGKLAVTLQPGAKAATDSADTDLREVKFEDVKLTLQKLTQNTNPMGKLVEFVDDDLEAMSKECRRWGKAFSETQERLQKIEDEQNLELQSFHATLNELNEQVFDYENRILSVRSRIQRNNAKIDAMLAKVIG